MNVTPSVRPEQPSLPIETSALLDAVPVALLGFHLQGSELRLFSANAAARRLQGLRSVRTPGVGAAQVFILLASTHVLEQLGGVAQSGEPLECRHVLRDQGRLVLAWKIHAHSIGIGRILVTVQDLSEAERLRISLAGTEEALHETRRELDEQTEVFGTMESMARTGYWRRIWDEGETVLLWSPGLCDIAGFDRQEWISPERALSGVLPEDRHIVTSAQAAEEGGDIEYRWRRPDGQVRWMRSRVRHPAQQGGVLVEMGVVQDVTEEHRFAERLRDQLDFIKSIASSIPGFIYQCRIHPDGSPSLPYVSEAVHDLMGVSDQLVQHDFQALELNVVDEDLPMVRRTVRRAVRDLRPWQCEYRVRSPEGDVRWHMTSAAVRAEADGSVLMHGYTLDVTDRKRAAKRCSSVTSCTTPISTNTPPCCAGWRTRERIQRT